MMLILRKFSSLYSASFDDNIQENADAELVVEPLTIPAPSTSGSFGPEVLGSCNGVLCLGFLRKYVIWNPSSRTHHVLPDDPTQEGRMLSVRSYFLVHGLGYDQLNNDYKLVRVVQFSGRDQEGVWNFDTQVCVYSLKSDSWTIFAEESNWFVSPVGFTDVFVNGSLHFKMQMTQEDSGYEYLIFAFDVSKETYQTITKPGFVDKDSEFDLGVLDGRLCMVPKGESEAGTFRVLAMKEYGDGSSWMELFQFQMDDVPGWMRPIAHLVTQNQNQNENQDQNQKQVLLEGGGKLFCFDVKNNSIRAVQIRGLNDDLCYFSEVCVCMEGEVALDSADGKLPKGKTKL